MYYVIGGRAVNNHTPMEGGTDRNNKFFFLDVCEYLVYSDECHLERVSGILLNDAISLFGYSKFKNVDRYGAVILSELIIYTHELGIVLSNRELYVAYRGYVYKTDILANIVYIHISGRTLSIFGTAYGTGVHMNFLFDNSGAINDAGFFKLLGRYTDDRADVALCKFML